MKASVNKIFYGDNLPVLKGFDDESVDLIYIDPPFNTGKSQMPNDGAAVKLLGKMKLGFKKSIQCPFYHLEGRTP